MKRIIVALMLLLVSISLSGCIADPKSGDNSPVVHQAAPVINLPKSEIVDTKELRDGIRSDIATSSNSNQNQLTGLVNTSVSKLAEKLTGLESNIDSLIKISNNMSANFSATATASADFRAKIDSAITLNNEIKSEIKAVATMINDIKISLSVINDIKTDVGAISTALSAMATAQVGLSNKVENLSAQAGRDVNMLPENAVKLLQFNLWTFVIVLIVLAAVGALTICLSFQAARSREQARTNEEKREKTHLYNLLMKAVVALPEKSATPIARELSDLNVGNSTQSQSSRV